LNTTKITYRPRVKTDFKQYTVHTMVCTHYKYLFICWINQCTSKCDL